MGVPLKPELIAYINRQRLGEEGKKVAGRKITIYSLPKVGKSVLAARLGQHNMFITDEDGYTSLMNDEVKPLIGHWDSLPWMDWPTVKQYLQAGEAKQILCECGEPIDNWIIDTMSGMVMGTLREIVRTANATQEGKTAPENPNRPEYMISRDRLIPVMQQVAQMRSASVTMLLHQREHDTKTNPHLNLDVHKAAAQVINKYTSVQAYLSMDENGQRKLQVRATSNKIVTGSRYQFPKDFVTDDEFVDHIEKWKAMA